MNWHVLALTLALTGCGAAYISPKVEGEAQDGTSVNVVEMTGSSIAAANQSPYTPKTLPKAFFANAGSGSSEARSAGVLPTPAAGPQTRPGALAIRLPPNAPAEPYRIGVSDVLLLATSSGGSTIEELSGLLAAQNRRQGYTVQDDGAIAIPEVGRIIVADQTLEEAEAVVFQKLVENQIDPTFSIEISQFNSKQVSIGGAVKSPGSAPITLRPLFLDEALSNAGGVATDDTEFAVVRLYRDGQLYQVPVSRLYNRQGLERVRLMDGDSIFVDTTYQLERATAYFEQQIRLTEARASARRDALDALETEVALRRNALEEARQNFRDREELGENDRDYVYVAGEVETQRRFTLPYGKDATLADALYEDGGIPTETGNPGQIYVLRADQSLTSITAYRLDGENVVNMIMATRMELRPNDIIFVAEQPITRWNRVVSQVLPSLSAVDAVNN